jgi:hypothetical protein
MADTTTDTQNKTTNSVELNILGTP